MLTQKLVLGAVVLTAATSQPQPVSDITLEAEDISFGPDGCVTLTRSGAGHCVLDTDCDGHDLSQFEFAFNCEDENGLGGDTIRHSYGFGGFDARETFETDVKCGKCALPSPPLTNGAPPQPAQPAPGAAAAAARDIADPNAAVALAAKANVVAAVATRTRTNTSWPWIWGEDNSKPELPSAKIIAPKDVQRYGPGNCVSTYKGEDGSCMMETDCAQEKAVATYDFAFICEEQDGSHAKHVFGRGSFDPVEKFDTLVKCKRCLPRDFDVPQRMQTTGNARQTTGNARNARQFTQDLKDAKLQDQVSTLRDMVKSLKDRMLSLTGTVQRITTRMYPDTQAPPAGMQPAPAAQQAALLNGKVLVVREKLLQGRGKAAATRWPRTNLRSGPAQTVLEASENEEQTDGEDSGEDDGLANDEVGLAASDRDADGQEEEDDAAAQQQEEQQQLQVTQSAADSDSDSDAAEAGSSADAEVAAEEAAEEAEEQAAEEDGLQAQDHAQGSGEEQQDEGEESGGSEEEDSPEDGEK